MFPHIHSYDALYAYWIPLTSVLKAGILAQKLVCMVCMVWIRFGQLCPPPMEEGAVNWEPYDKSVAQSSSEKIQYDPTSDELVLKGGRKGQYVWATTLQVSCNTSIMILALRRGETHGPVHCNFINLMKLPNEGTLIFLVPASNHFDVVLVMKWCLYDG